MLGDPVLVVSDPRDKAVLVQGCSPRHGRADRVQPGGFYFRAVKRGDVVRLFRRIYI
jgi:hypothetical protein